MNHFFEKKEHTLFRILEIATRDYFLEKDKHIEIEKRLRLNIEEILKALTDLRIESDSFDRARNRMLIL